MAFVWGVLRFVGITVGLFVISMILYFVMNLVRTVLAGMFVSRRPSDPAYAGPEKVASTAVFESGSIDFFPSATITCHRCRGCSESPRSG